MLSWRNKGQQDAVQVRLGFRCKVFQIRHGLEYRLKQIRRQYPLEVCPKALRHSLQTTRNLRRATNREETRVNPCTRLKLIPHTLLSASKISLKYISTSPFDTLAILYRHSAEKYRIRFSGSTKQSRTGYTNLSM